ncbi:hypothetical protein ACHAW6_004380 [Cyclotella cf. meneghiniana]
MHAQQDWRKEVQLANLIHCVLALASKTYEIDRGSKHTIRIVDFAGSTGHLAVPLALLLHHCEVVCVDLKKWSLVNGCLDDKATDQATIHKSEKAKATVMLPNLSTYCGSIQSYPYLFDIGISLHACGEASDWVLRKCLQQNASFVICSSCCERRGTRTFIIALEEMIRRYDILRITKAADYSELGDLRKPRNACQKVAKSSVEWDRILFAGEGLQTKDRTDFNGRNGGYVVLTCMLPWEASMKNDIIIGWCNGKVNPYQLQDKSCDDDFLIPLNHLFGTIVPSLGDAQITDALDYSRECPHDWSALEEAEIKRQMESFVQRSTSQEMGKGDTVMFLFPTGMGSRWQKLIHYAAEKMGLDHWGKGKNDREKTVVVALRRKVVTIE